MFIYYLNKIYCICVLFFLKICDLNKDYIRFENLLNLIIKYIMYEYLYDLQNIGYEILVNMR